MGRSSYLLRIGAVGYWQVVPFALDNSNLTEGRHTDQPMVWLEYETFLCVRNWLGRIAQLVEQLTLNQRVAGSIPAAPTNKIKGLGARIASYFVLSVKKLPHLLLR